MAFAVSTFAYFVALIEEISLLSDCVALCDGLFVMGCWVDRTVVNGLIVFVGGYSSLTVLQWRLWLLLFQLLLVFVALI